MKEKGAHEFEREQGWATWERLEVEEERGKWCNHILILKSKICICILKVKYSMFPCYNKISQTGQFNQHRCLSNSFRYIKPKIALSPFFIECPWLPHDVPCGWGLPGAQHIPVMGGNHS